MSGFEAETEAAEAVEAASSPSSSNNCFGDSPRDQESLENDVEEPLRRSTNLCPLFLFLEPRSGL